MSRRYLPLLILSTGIGFGLSASQLLLGDSAQARPQMIGNYNPAESLAPLVEKLSPAVVNIDVEQNVQMPDMPFLSPFGYQGGEEQLRTGQGSGVLISADGYLLTNHHVVDGADSVTVKLSDGKNYKGVIVGSDDSIDIALLKIRGANFPYVQLGSSESTRVGDWVVAIGNPFGLSHTVTTGIVSAKGRVIGSGPYDDYIQTDASINPGNSGGPLFNLQGEVVGINTAINPRAQGIGFSLPIDKVTKIIEDLKTGSVARGWLGVGLRTVEEAATGARQKGVYIAKVYPGTPAQEAGLKDNDLVLEFDGTAVSNQEELIRMVGQRRAKETINLRIKRNGREKSVPVTLGQRPTERDLSSGSFLSQSDGTFGLQIAEVSGFRDNPNEQGLVVLRVTKGSAAERYFQQGDILLSIDRETASLGKIQALVEQGQKARIQYLRQGREKKITVQF